MNKNENSNYQNLWNTVKAGLIRKFIKLNTYFRIEKRSKVNNFSYTLEN